MPLHRIDHVTINAADLAKTIAFYEKLGFKPQERPNIKFQGAWLALDGHPFVHVIHRRADQTPEIALIDHFAVAATDVPATRAHLTKEGIPFRENSIPDFKVHQIFVTDPDGVRIELNFSNQAA